MRSESATKATIKLVFRYLLGASFALQIILLLDSYVEPFTASSMTTVTLWTSVLVGGVPIFWILKPLFSTRAMLVVFLAGIHIMSLAAAMLTNAVMILVFPSAFGILGIVLWSLGSWFISMMDKADSSTTKACRPVQFSNFVEVKAESDGQQSKFKLIEITSWNDTYESPFITGLDANSLIKYQLYDEK